MTSSPESVYVVQRECMDYYCGCGGGHIVGVFTDLAVANAATDVPATIHRLTTVTLNEYRWADSIDDVKDRHAWT